MLPAMIDPSKGRVSVPCRFPRKGEPSGFRVEVDFRFRGNDAQKQLRGNLNRLKLAPRTFFPNADNSIAELQFLTASNLDQETSASILLSDQAWRVKTTRESMALNASVLLGWTIPSSFLETRFEPA